MPRAAWNRQVERAHSTEPFQAWLADRDPRVRQGTCFVIKSLQWSQELEDLILPRLRDRNWDVRVAARAAFEDLILSKETARLAEAVTGEEDMSRRWTLVEAALMIGYPGVVAGYGAHSWFGPMCEGQPYVLQGYAVTKLEENRKKLRSDLAKRERT